MGIELGRDCLVHACSFRRMRCLLSQKRRLIRILLFSCVQEVEAAAADRAIAVAAAAAAAIAAKQAAALQAKAEREAAAEAAAAEAAAGVSAAAQRAPTQIQRAATPPGGAQGAGSNYSVSDLELLGEVQPCCFCLGRQLPVVGPRFVISELCATGAAGKGATCNLSLQKTLSVKPAWLIFLKP